MYTYLGEFKQKKDDNKVEQNPLCATLQRNKCLMLINLCHLMLQDRPFCDQITEVLNVEFLQYEYLRVFVGVLLEYRKKYKTHPSYDVMATHVKAGLDGY